MIHLHRRFWVKGVRFGFKVSGGISNLSGGALGCLGCRVSGGFGVFKGLGFMASGLKAKAYGLGCSSRSSTPQAAALIEHLQLF